MDINVPSRVPSGGKPTRASNAEPVLSSTKLRTHLKDLFVLALLLCGVAAYGYSLQAKAAAAHGHGDEHGGGGHEEEAHGHDDPHGHHRRALSGGHHVDPYLDVQVTVGICAVLIFVTVAFELAKHKVEHDTPPMYQAVLQAMFGELTVLGFIALYTYFMLRLGVLEWFSLQIYHDPEHLIHLFEDIHFMLFFVMLVFLLQAVLLVNASLIAESRWMAIDKTMSALAGPIDMPAGKGPWAGPLIARFGATVQAAGQSCMRCPWPVWGYRLEEAKEQAEYALLRDRFVHPPKGESASVGSHMPVLPADFELSAYLRRCCTHEAAHVLHVTPTTWMLVLLFIGATFEGPVYSHEKAHLDADSTWVIVLGWSLWLFSMVVRWKVQSVQAALTPKHAGLEEGTWAADEEAGTAKLLGGPPGAPPYESESKASKHGSKHANLFWKGSHGPHHLTFLMQILMLFSAITLAVAYSWLNAHPEETLVLLVAFFPILDTLLNHSKYLLPLIVMTTNIEQLKKGHALAETLSEMSAEKTLRMLKLLNTMATQAKRANKNAPAPPPKKGAKPAQKVDPEQEAALIQAFKFFDSSGDGTIDSTELGGVMVGVDAHSRACPVCASAESRGAHRATPQA